MPHPNQYYIIIQLLYSKSGSKGSNSSGQPDETNLDLSTGEKP